MTSYSYAVDIKLLEQSIEAHLHDTFFFVNLGANDGVLNDPIFPFIDRFGWRGVALEPVPYVFDLLKHNLAPYPQVTPLNAAVGAGPMTLWYVDRSANIGWQSASFDRQRVLDDIDWHQRVLPPVRPDRQRGGYLKRLPPVETDEGLPMGTADPETYLRRLDLDGLTFDEIVARAGVDRVDLVNLDIEGLDLEVARTIDVERYGINVLIVETAGFSEEEIADFNDHLARQGLHFERAFGILSSVYIR